MSLRALGTRLFRHGQTYVRHLCRRDFNVNIVDRVNASSEVSTASQQLSVRSAPRTFALRSVGLQVGLHARRIFIDNVLNRVTNSLAADLRRRAARRILFGDSAPFFTLVGVSLASGSGILTKEEELEGVCWEIREAVSKIKWKFHDVDVDETRFNENPLTLKDLELEEPIEKGAFAVVYAARVKQHEEEVRAEDAARDSSLDVKPKRDELDCFNSYPLAVKMMFNYDIQSNSMDILRGMYRETVPVRFYFGDTGLSDWEIGLSSRNRHVPPHPNIVAMFSAFTDYIPELRNARGLYPAALPRRIYSEGEGRNMSLFLVMKRYNCNLQQYLTETKPSTRTCLLLLAQLLEAVAHLTAHGVAHRDLKSDNLLLDTVEDNAPILVISDFGCCLADKYNGLHLPYTSPEINKGGNAALMAPEILNQTPGTFSVLNYSKSDLWAAGAIAYEIFGMPNPFYGTLQSDSYSDECLPDLPVEVPAIVQALVKNLLSRNPRKRLDPEVAANVCQLLLWAPSKWLKRFEAKIPSSAEILEWLLCLTTKVLCEGSLKRLPSQISATSPSESTIQGGKQTNTNYKAKLSNIKSALSWIQDSYM